MSLDQFEERLQRSLVDRAESLTGAPAFSADDVVTSARRARVRRRGATATGIGVLAGVVAITVVLTTRAPAVPMPQPLDSAPAPVMTDAPAPTSAPAPTQQALPNTVDINDVGLGVLSGHTLRGFGLDVTLPGAGLTERSAVRIANQGWVIERYQDGGGSSSLWFRSDAGSLTKIGDFYGTYAVSPDGRTVVVSGVESPASVVAYRLPTLERLRATVFDRGLGPIVLGIGGDWAIIREASGDGSPSAAAAWNLRTGELKVADGEVNIWGVTAAGKVLRWTPPDANAPPCVDLLTVSEFVKVGVSGLCHDGFATGGLIGRVSPDGRWVGIDSSAFAPALLRISDVLAGRWEPRPVALPPDSLIIYWDTATTLIGEGPDGTFYRCQAEGACVQLALPADLFDGSLIPSRG